jgi:hypothetical protein
MPDLFCGMFAQQVLGGVHPDGMLTGDRHRRLRQSAYRGASESHGDVHTWRRA